MTKELSQQSLMPETFTEKKINTESHIKVIIPIYNEEHTITDLINRTMDVFSKMKKVAEIICVDDGSIDNSRAILNGLDITLLINEKNLGKGEALKKGFKLCNRSDIIIIFDGDGQHCPEDIPKLLEPLYYNQADIVIGSRFMKTQNGNKSYLNKKKYIPHVRKIGNQIFSLFGTLITQKYITDTQSGFRAFRPNVIHNLNLKANGFEIETEIIIEANEKHYRIKEVPINNGDSQRDSYMNIVSDGLKIILTFISGAFPKKLKFIINYFIDKINKIR